MRLGIPELRRGLVISRQGCQKMRKGHEHEWVVFHFDDDSRESTYCEESTSCFLPRFDFLHPADKCCFDTSASLLSLHSYMCPYQNGRQRAHWLSKLAKGERSSWAGETKVWLAYHMPYWMCLDPFGG